MVLAGFVYKEPKPEPLDLVLWTSGVLEGLARQADSISSLVIMPSSPNRTSGIWAGCCVSLEFHLALA